MEIKAKAKDSGQSNSSNKKISDKIRKQMTNQAIVKNVQNVTRKYSCKNI